MFWQSCNKRWTHILLPSQHSCANSAADHLHLSLPSITTLIAAVRLESDHGWERDIKAVLAWVNREDEEDHDDAPLNHTTLKIAVSAPNICVPALHEPVKYLNRVKFWSSWKLGSIYWCCMNRKQQDKLDQNHILNVLWPFSRCSRWLWGHWWWRYHSNIWSRWGSKGRWSNGASHSWH